MARRDGRSLKHRRRRPPAWRYPLVKLSATGRPVAWTGSRWVPLRSLEARR